MEITVIFRKVLKAHWYYPIQERDAISNECLIKSET